MRHVEPAKLVKAVRGDLDWIVMKALEKDRTRRYETANGFAADINRYLAGEPVVAAPPSAAYRLKKFARKHRVGLTTAAAVGVLIAVGITVFLIQQASHARAIERKNTQLTQSNFALEAQRKKAEAREQMAIDAVKRFRDAVVEDETLKNSPSLESLRKKLLKEPLAFFKTLREQLQADNDTRPESLTRLASAAFELGYLTDQIGDKVDALRAYLESLAIRERLAREHRGVTAFQISLAHNHNNLGNLQREMGHPDQALESHGKALEIRERLARDNRSDNEFQRNLAGSHHNIGILQYQTGHPDQALESYGKSLAIRQKLAREYQSVTAFQSDLASSYDDIGSLQYDMGLTDPALESYGKALEIRKRLALEHNGVSAFQDGLARSHHSLGFLLSAGRRNAEAVREYEAALEIRERLARANPSNIEFQRFLATTYNNIGGPQRDMGHPEQALESFGKALQIFDRLARDHPSALEHQNDLAACHYNIGILQRTMSQLGLAHQSFGKALAIREKLAREHPEFPDYASDLGGTLLNMASFDLNEKRWVAARAKIKQAMDWQKKALASNPSHPRYRLFYEGQLAGLMKAAEALGNDQEATATARELANFQATDPGKAVLDARLVAVFSGEVPKDNPERLALGQRAHDTKQYALAARLWGEALRSAPELVDDRQKRFRYNAACAKLRQQALTYLQAELETWTKLFESATPEQMQGIAQTLNHWRNVDSDLAGIRDEAELAKLPESEQAALHQLWSAVDRLHGQAMTNPGPNPSPTEKK